MPNRDVSEPYVEMNRPASGAGGRHAEDEPDLEGYDDSQRAEIAEAEGDGPTDGIVMTDMQPDMGEEIEDGSDAIDRIIDTDRD